MEFYKAAFSKFEQNGKKIDIIGKKKWIKDIYLVLDGITETLQIALNQFENLVEFSLDKVAINLMKEKGIQESRRYRRRY
jgi:hypothetical protein